MLALYIILGIILFLFLLTLLNIVIYFDYENEPRLSVRIAFVKLGIIPSKPKKKKKKKKEKKPKKEKKKKDNKPEPAEEKKPSAFNKLRKEKGLSGIIDIVKSLADLAVGTLKDVFGALRVKKLDFSIRVGGKDAADTAVKYGYVCSAVFPAMAIIMKAVKVKRYNIQVEPDFSDEPSTEINVSTVIKIRIIRILKIVIVRAVQALKIYIHKIR